MRILHVLGVRNGERTLEEIERCVSLIRKRRRSLRLTRRKLQKKVDLAQRLEREGEEHDDAG